MPTKYGYIQIKAPIDELWNKCLQYWEIKRVKSTNFQISEDGSIRKMEFKSRPSMHLYAYSFGEKYRFQFLYRPQSGVSTIIISCKYSIFGGRGFIWKIPQESINEWVKYIHLPPIKLNNEPDPDYLAIKSLMAQIQVSSRKSPSSNYCPNCGNPLTG